MTFDPIAIHAGAVAADVSGNLRSNSDAFRALQPGDLEPWRELLTSFILTGTAGMALGEVNQLIQQPRSFTYSLPRFADWLVVTNQTDAVPSGDTVDPEHTLEYWIAQRDYDRAAFERLDVAWMATFRPRFDDYCENRGYADNWERDYLRPGGNTIGVKRFFRWMLDNPVTADDSAETEPTGFYSLDELRHYSGGSGDGAPYDHARFTPWADTIRRFVRSVPATVHSLMDGTHETDPEAHDTLGNLLEHGPRAYPGTIPAFVTWLDASGQSTPDSEGSGATTPTPEEHPITFDFDMTPQYLADHRVEILSTVRPQFMQWAREVGLGGDNEAPGSWRDFMVTGNTTDDYWPGVDWTGPRYLPAFLTWARQHRDLFPDSRVPSGDSSATLRDQVVGLLDTEMYQWPRDVREALAPEIARYHHETDRFRTLENARTNSDYALLFEDNASTWSHREFTVHRRFRDAVRDGSFVIQYPEATTTTTTPATTEETPITDPVIVPIGPEHPGWQAFAEQLAATATAHGMCPEYDRIARAVGLPTRREKVLYRVVLEVPVEVERGGYNADVRQLREAAAALLASTELRPRALEIRRDQVVG